MVCVAYFFMLDTQDIQVLREMFGEMLGKNNVILRDEMLGIRDEILVKMHEELYSVRDEIYTKIHEEARAVCDDIIEVINDGVLPQIDRLNIRVTRLERMQRQSSF